MDDDAESFPLAIIIMLNEDDDSEFVLVIDIVLDDNACDGFDVVFDVLSEDFDSPTTKPTRTNVAIDVFVFDMFYIFVRKLSSFVGED